MCSNYRTVTRMDRMLTFFGVERGRDELPPEEEVWPLGLAPFIRRAEEGSGNKVVEAGQFGLMPHFAKELAYGRRTYNARSETVDKLASFKDSWLRGRRCVIPVEAIYEPCYESGKAVRWSISQDHDIPLGIAGIYREFKHPNDGRPMYSFAMLTVNADGHPVFSRMHRPGEEKRMVVILEPAEYDRWLWCSVEEARGFFRQWSGPLLAQPAPLPPRAPRPRDEPKAGPLPPEDGAPGLF